MTVTQANLLALRQAVDDVGGLVAQSDLARRWGIGRSMVCQLAARPGFPAPFAVISGKPVYVAGLCDEWRERHVNTRTKHPQKWGGSSEAAALSDSGGRDS